jgi:hypothetical protein
MIIVTQRVLTLETAPPFRISQRESKLFLLNVVYSSLGLIAGNARTNAMAKCNKRILEHQTDFCDQKSLVQVIEDVAHGTFVHFFAEIPL